MGVYESPRITRIVQESITFCNIVPTQILRVYAAISSEKKLYKLGRIDQVVRDYFDKK